MKLEVQDICTVDYFHAIPCYNGKCSSIHGHLSFLLSASVDGEPSGDFLIDFKELKSIIKTVAEELDHKIVISKKYFSGSYKSGVLISWTTPSGDEFSISCPAHSVLFLDGEATIENICRYIAEKSLSLLPKNIKSITIKMTEGIRNLCEVSISREPKS